ncbi:MAG: hypothetical protein IJ737_06310 [Ruminococcus sp.]|nr:hypothetical protein [Ruminococcus sp.]
MKARYRYAAVAAAAAVAVSVAAAAASCGKKKPPAVTSVPLSAYEGTIPDELSPDWSSVSVEESSSETDKKPTPAVSHLPSTAAEGRYINMLYSLLKSGEYELKMKYTDCTGEEIDILRVVDGSDFYQLRTDSTGSSGVVKKDGTCYDFDMLCGIYRENSTRGLDDLVQGIVDGQLPMTRTRIDPVLANVYDVEEYTYTGDTYITVMDFYFDRETGLPVRYVTTYSNEDGDLVETRDFEYIAPGSYFASLDTSGDDSSSEPQEEGPYSKWLMPSEDEQLSVPETSEEIDVSLIDSSFLWAMNDFDSMTDDARKSYCMSTFWNQGVTQQELFEAGFDEEQLKHISFERFTYIVYTYGGTE